MTITFTPTAEETLKLREISGAGMMECRKALISRNISRQLNTGQINEAMLLAILKYLLLVGFRIDDRLMAAAQELDA